MEIRPVVVVPKEEDLKIESAGCVCEVDGCAKLFKGSAQLHMHFIKHHQGRKLGVKSGSSVFYCPVENCDRGVSSGKPFPRLGQLKQHYQRIHGAKSHSCQKCGKQFSLRDECERHETECGQTFICSDCGEDFRTRNALYKHARRKSHTLPQGSKVRARGKKSPSLLPTTSQQTPQAIVVKRVVRLAKLVSAATQTEDSDVRDAAGSSVACEIPPAPSYQQPVLDPSYGVDPLPTLDLSTQTEPCSDSTFDLSDYATQTDLTGLFDFGTQTTFEPTSSQGCQTVVDHALATQSCQTPEFGGSVDLYSSIPNNQCEPLCCVDGYSTTDMNMDGFFVEFGTQTLERPHHSTMETTPDDLLVEFGTQTLPPNTMETDFSMDFGTQTTQPLPHVTPDDILTEFGTQTTNHTSDVSVEFGTQTSSDDIQALLAIATQTGELAMATQTEEQALLAMATQTEEQALLAIATQTGELAMATQTEEQALLAMATQTEEQALLAMATQTEEQALLAIATQTEDESFLYDQLSSLQSRIDFGTQTIDELFSEVGSFLRPAGLDGEAENKGGNSSASRLPCSGSEFNTPQ